MYCSAGCWGGGVLGLETETSLKRRLMVLARGEGPTG